MLLIEEAAAADGGEDLEDDRTVDLGAGRDRERRDDGHAFADLRGGAQ